MGARPKWKVTGAKLCSEDASEVTCATLSQLFRFSATPPVFGDPSGFPLPLRFSSSSATSLQLFLDRYRANMAHIRQPRPNSGLDFQVRALEPFRVVASSLGRGPSEVLLQLLLKLSLQGYLAHKKTPPPQDPKVGLCLGPCGGPWGGGGFL